MKYSKNDLAFIKGGKAPQRTTDVKMDGKLCILSGATSGVGLAAARKLAEGGANLVLVARSGEKAEAVKQELENAFSADVKYVLADFNRLSDVRRAALEIQTRYPAIDVLINSAGLYSTRRKLTPDGNELTFQVNHLATFLLTMLLLNNISKSPQGRIIHVNSEGHRFGGLNPNDLDWHIRFYIGLRAYGASKIAQLMTMDTLDKLLLETGITINAMHPGTVSSDIGNNNGLAYRSIMRFAKRFLMKTPAVSGEALYYLAAAPELRATSGKYFFLTNEAKPYAVVLDETLRAQIWKKSLELTGLMQAF